MKKTLSPRLQALAAVLFDKPASQSYVLIGMGLIVTGFSVAFTDTHIPSAVKLLIMILCLVGASRLYSHPALRMVWVATVGLMTLGMFLQGALFVASLL
jgi:hypothetical protein